MATISSSPATWEAVEAPISFVFSASPPSYVVNRITVGTRMNIETAGINSGIAEGDTIRLDAPPQYNNVEATVLDVQTVVGPNITIYRISASFFNGTAAGRLYFDLDSVAPPEFDIIAGGQTITERPVAIVPFGDGAAPAEVQAWLKTAVANRLDVLFDGDEVDNNCFSEYKLNYRDLGGGGGFDTGSFYVLNAARQAGSEPLAVSLLTELEAISRWDGFPVGVHALVMADPATENATGAVLSANAVHFVDLQNAVEGAEVYLSV